MMACMTIQPSGRWSGGAIFVAVNLFQFLDKCAVADSANWMKSAGHRAMAVPEFLFLTGLGSCLRYYQFRTTPIIPQNRVGSADDNRRDRLANTSGGLMIRLFRRHRPGVQTTSCQP